MTALACSDEIGLGLKGAVVANEYCYIYKNRLYRGDGTVPGFIYCGGYSAGGPNIVGAGFAKRLAMLGYPVISGDFGDTPTQALRTDGPGWWGNDAGIAKMELHRTFLQNQLGAKPGKVGILYGSHGGAGAYAYAAAHPGNVYCIAGVIGTVDVEDIRANNRGAGGGYQASIESRYTNNAGWQAARPTHNPVEVAASLTIPQLDYYSDDDPICTLASHQALGTAAGANITQISMGNSGHTFAMGFNQRDHALTKAFVDWTLARLT